MYPHALAAEATTTNGGKTSTNAGCSPGCAANTIRCLMPLSAQALKPVKECATLATVAKPLLDGVNGSLVS